MLRKLKFSLYGTRDASMNWAKQHTQHLSKVGFQKEEERQRAILCINPETSV